MPSDTHEGRMGILSQWTKKRRACDRRDVLLNEGKSGRTRGEVKMPTWNELIDYQGGRNLQ